MKFISLALALAFVVTACADSRVIEGTCYKPYGFLSLDEENPDVKYEVSWGNVFWGVLLSETIVMPIYVFGFRLYEPVCSKSAAPEPGEACP